MHLGFSFHDVRRGFSPSSNSQHAKVLEEVGARSPSQRFVCDERAYFTLIFLEHVRTEATIQVLLTASAGAELLNLHVSKLVKTKDSPQVRLSQCFSLVVLTCLKNSLVAAPPSMVIVCDAVAISPVTELARVRSLLSHTTVSSPDKKHLSMSGFSSAREFC